MRGPGGEISLGAKIVFLAETSGKRQKNSGFLPQFLEDVEILSIFAPEKSECNTR
jgi:hypothetical protein